MTNKIKVTNKLLPSKDKKCDGYEIHLVMFHFSQCGNMCPQYFSGCLDFTQV